MNNVWILWHADSNTEERLTYMEGMKTYGEKAWRKILAGKDDNIFPRRA